MRKEDVASYVVYLIMVALAVIIGFTVLQDLVSELNNNNIPFGSPLMFSICMVVSAIIFNALLIELGHLIGGAIGGYKTFFFSVLWLTFFRKNGKVKFGFRNYDGLTGETKIVPKKANANPKAYVWFPILFYIIELLSVIIVIQLVSKSSNVEDLQWLIVTSFIFACVGGLIVLYDYVPFRLDSMTDGYRLTLLSKKVNVVALNKKLEIEYAEMNGGEIPETPFYEEITDYTASINLLQVYKMLSDKAYVEAEEALNKIIADPKLINLETHNTCISLLVYIHLMEDEYLKAQQYYANIPTTARKYISSEVSMDALTACVLVSGLIEKSKSEVDLVISKKAKALKRTPEGRKELSKELFDRAIEKIQSENPELF